MIPAVLIAGALFSSSPGPVSQWGGGSISGVLLFNEPMVDLLAIEAHVKIAGDDVEVRLRYLLKSRAGARQVQLAIPVVMRSVELDGDAPAPSPFKDPQVLVQGKPVKTGTTVEPTREQYFCGASVEGMPAGSPRAHLLRFSATLDAEATTTVEARFVTHLMHDDWRGLDGKLTQSARAMCLQMKPPVGFAGLAKGRARWDIHVENPKASVVITPGQEQKPGEFRWSADDVELREVPDISVRIAAP